MIRGKNSGAREIYSVSSDHRLYLLSLATIVRIYSISHKRVLRLSTDNRQPATDNYQPSNDNQCFIFLPPLGIVALL
jgi:hypothetical protein